MQAIADAVKDWWPFVFLGAALLIIDAFRRSRALFRSLKKRTDEVKPQYTQIEALFIKSRKMTTVSIRVHLENPHPYPVKLTIKRMRTTIGFRSTDFIPEGYASIILSAGTKRVNVESRPVEMPRFPSSGNLTGYIEWELNCARSDPAVVGFSDTFRLRGDISIRDVGRGPEIQWRPFDDSEQMVDDENMELLSDETGEPTRRRRLKH